MIIHKLFPTVIGEFDLSTCYDPLQVKSFLDSYNTKTHSLVPNGISSYTSGHSLLTEFELNSLNDHFQNCVDSYAEQTSLEPMYISNSWFNKLTKGSRTTLHRHEGSVLSGAFYPYADNDSISLSFRSPLRPHRMNDLFISTNHLNSDFESFPAKVGTLYLFPSWLEHETDINQSNERYVISFNTGRIS